MHQLLIKKKIIGSITVDDVVDVIEEEREEDILKLGGVGHTDIYNSVIDTTKSRIIMVNCKFNDSSCCFFSNRFI